MNRDDVFSTKNKFLCFDSNFREKWFLLFYFSSSSSFCVFSFVSTRRICHRLETQFLSLELEKKPAENFVFLHWPTRFNYFRVFLLIPLILSLLEQLVRKLDSTSLNEKEMFRCAFANGFILLGLGISSTLESELSDCSLDEVERRRTVVETFATGRITFETVWFDDAFESIVGFDGGGGGSLRLSSSSESWLSKIAENKSIGGRDEDSWKRKCQRCSTRKIRIVLLIEWSVPLVLLVLRLQHLEFHKPTSKRRLVVKQLLVDSIRQAFSRSN